MVPKVWGGKGPPKRDRLLFSHIAVQIRLHIIFEKRTALERTTGSRRAVGMHVVNRKQKRVCLYM